MLAFALLALLGVCGAILERRDIVMMEMDDGVRLHTRITLPRNYEEGDKRTAVMDRSPYSEFGIELLDYLFLPAGFVAVTQDMRGTGMSGGHFSNWQSDANDSLTCGNWITSQPWSDGKVFNFGASADGLGAFTTNLNSPEWLFSQYFIWTSSIGYEVIYPNGALLEDLLNNWIYGTVRPDDVDESYGEFMANEAKTDWWETLDFTGNYDLIKQGRFGFWAGWYDIFLVGTLAAYDGFNYEAASPARYNSVLLIDPCGHCQDAAEFFSEDVIAGRTALGLMQAYDVFGVRPVKRTNIQNVTFYVMSSNDDAGREVGQYWTTMEAFPKPVMTKFYLHGDGSASTTLPAAGSAADAAESTTYVYDPASPASTNGGNNLFSSTHCGPLEQQDIDARDDTITFQTEAMTEELALTGAINAQLYVSSDAVDTDFMVRVSDVYPTGEVRLLQDSAARMRWREGGLEPVYMTNGTVYPASLSLWNTSYVVAPGHALRIAISSSNAPRFSVNPNNGLLLADPAYPGENVVATNTVWHSDKYPSYLELPVVDKRRQLPQIHDLKGQFQAAYPFVDYDKAMEEGPALLEKLAKLSSSNLNKAKKMM